METAGAMGWSLDQFWQATPIELEWMFKGFLRARGINPDVEITKPMSKAEALDAFAKHDKKHPPKT